MSVDCVTEFMVHPGYVTDAQQGGCGNVSYHARCGMHAVELQIPLTLTPSLFCLISFWFPKGPDDFAQSADRVAELEFLCSQQFQGHLQKTGVQLCGFNRLADLLKATGSP